MRRISLQIATIVCALLRVAVAAWDGIGQPANSRGLPRATTRSTISAGCRRSSTRLPLRRLKARR